MKPVKSDVQFPTVEQSILRFWKERGIMEMGLKANEGKTPYVFYDGPPFATGLPHYGHILAGTLKDIVPRYWVMRGHYVQRRWGWDCHGLPVEFEMENELGLSGLHEVERYGIAKFNEACRGIVQRYTKEWEEIIYRTGRWVDFKNNYRTMDTPFMESVWWVIRQLWEKGLIYEGYRVMPYSWRISTPLSNFEAGLNYKEVQDPAVTLKFKADSGNHYYLAWTTTPWTLPSNLALAVHRDVTYVEVEEKASQERYILAEARLGAYYKSESEYSVLRSFPGSALEGQSYEPLFPYFASHKKQGAFKVVLGDHVTTTDGTGIVHTAPAFGEDDFNVCQKYGIVLVNPVDAEGRFTTEVPDYQGLNVKEADKAIIKDLKSRGQLLRHETLVHNYPFCWRSDTPLIYKAIPAWFVKLEPLKPGLIANNQKTHWVPEHLRDGRFGNWLENARDWNISRNRFWGTPIPIWRCEAKGCGEKICVGSVDELERLSGKRPSDLHKHFVDEITIPCPKCKTPSKRVPEVLDCWFESGSMPYGQAHYPFENQAQFEKSFPADFIAEGLDQTRGWFYTLSVLSTALFDKPPFRNVIVNGLVLAEDGKKMSKRLKNYPDPTYLLDTYGADALRAYLMTSPASHAEELRFSESGVKEIVRSVLLPFWNAYSFLVTYARADGWEPENFKPEALNRLSNDLDRWMVSRLHSLVKTVDEKMEVYHLYEVVPQVVQFIDELTNWYIRLNRRRFWQEEKTQDKELAYGTLYYTLVEFAKVLAPILPFITEEIYQNLATGSHPESVHLCRWPTVNPQWIKPEVEAQMSLVQSVVSMGRSCRATNKLKTRQPLKEILIITKNPKDREIVEKYASLIAQELNVKKVSFSNEETKWVNLTAKANAKVLGPRLGTKMKLFLNKIRELSHGQVAELEEKESLVLEGETIHLNEVTIEKQPKQAGLIQTTGPVTIWLDTTLDEALIKEGLAREFVNRIQKLRKETGLDVTDRIRTHYQGAPELKAALTEFKDYIQSETLSESLQEASQGAWTIDEEIDGLKLQARIEKL